MRKESFMFGLFSKKNSDGSEKLPGPKGVPDSVGQALVVQFKEDPNWAWSLKAVMKPQANKDLFDIRVYSDPMVSKVKLPVKDYTSLDSNPELILYDGVYDKKNKKVKLQNKYKNP